MTIAAAAELDALHATNDGLVGATIAQRGMRCMLLQTPLVLALALLAHR